MPSGRAQGAMEYLMSYGWAVLVVMVVGVGLWRMGVLNTGVSAASSTGFEALKPVLASCSYVKNYGDWGGWDGAYCQFVNGAGSPVHITHALVLIDGRECSLMFASLNPRPMAQPNMWANFWCPAQPCTVDNGNLWMDSCTDRSCTNCWDACQDWGMGPRCNCNDVLVQKGSTFSAGTMGNPAGGGGACSLPKSGDVVTLDVSLRYTVNIGGQTATKHSAGQIKMTAP